MKRWLALALWLIASPAWAAAPTLGAHTQKTVDGSSAAFSFTSSGSSGVIVVTVSLFNDAGAAPSVSSLTITGLTPVLRFSKNENLTGSNGDAEIWWAPFSSTVTGATITVNATGSSAMAIAAFEVNGVGNVNTPWDPNPKLTSWARLPFRNFVCSVYTTNPNDLIIGFWAAGTNGAPPTMAGGTRIEYAELFTFGHGFGANATDYKRESVHYTNVTVPWTADEGAAIDILFVDALTADAGGTAAAGSGTGTCDYHFLGHFAFGWPW